MRISPLLVAATLPLGLLTCCTADTPPPKPAAAPRPPPPAPAAVTGDWRDAPLTPGKWTYDPASGAATYGDGTEILKMACDKSSHVVSFTGLASVAGQPAMEVRMTTTFGERRFPTVMLGGVNSAAAVRLNANDSFLDSVAYSRGRFMIEAAAGRLILPAWPEVARVIEDCRS